MTAPMTRFSAAVLIGAITLAAACTGPADEAPVSADQPGTAQATVQAQDTAHASCSADVEYLPMPDDLAGPNFTRYTELVMDGRSTMRFAIGDTVTDAQVERAIRVTRFYLQDVPGSRYGEDKSGVREALAANAATMLLPNGAHEEGQGGDLPRGQELYAAEIAAEGSTWYTEHDLEHRDATLEEVFHQIHDVGIGTDKPGALPEYQAEILAEAESTMGTKWGIGQDAWLAELAAEGSLAQEYIAAVIDIWYGMWGPWDGERGMWDLYLAKTRGGVRELDQTGAELLTAFLPDVLEYEAYIAPEFEGTFYLAFDETIPYTHKSQYLRGARLTGNIASNLAGNKLDNTLRGNSADNHLDGGPGDDSAIYCSAQSQYVLTTEGSTTTISGPDGTDTLTNVESVRFADGAIALGTAAVDAVESAPPDLADIDALLGTPLPIPDVTPRSAVLPRLEPMAEIDRVTAHAAGVAVNDLGHHEARFSDASDMIFVPGGTFTTGNDALEPEAAPAHPVTLSPYWIAKTPVTIAEFRAFIQDTGYLTNVDLPGHYGSWVYNFDARGFVPTPGHRWDNSFHQVTRRFPELTVTDEHPVVNVSWYDCIAYANWLTDQHGLPFTLPTEAEWEYAARGDDARTYPWGNQDPGPTLANYADEQFDQYFPGTEQSVVHHGVDDGFAITSPVGSFPAGRSPVGALDMAGNVTEWVYDTYHEYTAEPQLDPIGLNDPGIRMQKAGFWAGSAGRFDVTPDEIADGHNIRSDARQGDDPASADDHLGCRVAISYSARPAAD